MTINKSILYKSQTMDSVLRPIKDELLNMVDVINNFVNNNENDLKKAIDETIEAEARRMDRHSDESDILTIECKLMHNPCAIPKISRHQDCDNYYISVNLPIMYYKDLDDSQRPNNEIAFTTMAENYIKSDVEISNFTYYTELKCLSITLSSDTYFQKVSDDLIKLFTTYLYEQGIKAEVYGNCYTVVIRINRNNFEITNT